jgi:hypothetical protein
MHHFLLSIDDDRSGCGRGIPAVPPASGRFLIGFWYRQRHFTTHRAMGQSFTAKTPKNAEEEKASPQRTQRPPSKRKA